MEAERWIRYRQILCNKIALTEEFGYFCGIYLAEGHVHGSSPATYVTQNNREILERVKAFGEKLGFHSIIQVDPETDHKQAAIFGVSFARWIEEQFGTGSANKQIPDWVLNAPDEFSVGLLRGYFDGDGYARGRQHHSIEYITKSRRLKNDIACVLLRFGIVTRMNLKSKFVSGTEYQRAALSGESYVRFLDTIGGRMKLRHEDSPWTYDSCDVIPIEPKVIGRRMAQHVADTKPPTPSLHRLAYSQVYWDEIVEMRYAFHRPPILSMTLPLRTTKTSMRMGFSSTTLG